MNAKEQLAALEAEKDVLVAAAEYEEALEKFRKSGSKAAKERYTAAADKLNKLRSGYRQGEARPQVVVAGPSAPKKKGFWALLKGEA